MLQIEREVDTVLDIGKELQNVITPPLLGLPVDILFEIFPLLPLPSQVCLALSCKSLFRLFSSTLQDERLAWPGLLACKTFTLSKCGSSDEISPVALRTQLLLQLQDDYWVYCAACLKLQPRALFWPGIESFPPLSLECIYTARVIDLCPCLSLTFFDRIRLERWLHTGLTDTLSKRIRESFQLLTTAGQASLVHKCSIPNIPGVLVDIMITVSFNESMRLEAQTGYHVRMNSYRPTHWRVDYLNWQGHPTEHLFLCPHVDLLRFICNSSFWPRVACRSCETSAWVASCEEEALIAREESHNITGAIIMYNAKTFGTSALFWEDFYAAWNRRHLMVP
ncbi:hypothetical protein BDV38DRAFT_296794 [Aspergillus pseudotamarii]|uniref:F-box domain-containing protein n=1 Tax=Aspergillus pseudotamarii TaxID=132259 RepID=A0A5N6T4N3_ASPPS|nr:uncharacterized protein BDV38DRAFT_296794 [Aspergillus pseudotamarii]KAE8141265.1 hypothetical protein BDV38DRAFT_296794 [Aspergillus pseudotamarii]